MAGQGIAGQGFIGIAFETTYGTYVPPTRFFPIKSESMSAAYQNQKRQLIRGVVDNLGHVAGFNSVAGDIEMELIEDVLPYFLYVSRNAVTKTGTGPWVYACLPTHIGAASSLPAGKKAMSITIVKNGEVFGYVGCVVGAIKIGVDNGIPSLKISVVGSDEATQTLPTYTALATDAPFGAGQYSVEIPTATQVFDVSNFTFTVNDNASPQFRLNNTRKAQWVAWGAREVMLNIEKDFTIRTEWDAFKAMTAASITVSMTKSASALVSIVLPNAIRDTMEIDGLSDQGAVVGQTVAYSGDYDVTTSASYILTVKSAVTNIT